MREAGGARHRSLKIAQPEDALLTAEPPENMTVVEISASGGPEVLKPATRPVPRPKAGEVLIRVAAAGVNGPDLWQRRGIYPPPKGATDLPGLVPGRRQELAVDLEVGEPELGHTALARSEQLAGAAEAKVLLGDPEAVVALAHDVEARPGGPGERRSVHQ